MKKMGGKSGVLWEIGGDFCATFQYNEDWICLLRRRDMYLRYVHTDGGGILRDLACATAK